MVGVDPVKVHGNVTKGVCGGVGREDVHSNVCWCMMQRVSQGEGVHSQCVFKRVLKCKVIKFYFKKFIPGTYKECALFHFCQL